ncbi:RdRP-domain-containing protein [Dothidotthia symphoricarpi CBS 119687]|uniref:RNA-dependent RNA polymerase n=1 Tax=Dothidotthia symphoricarpi CBS 119687 TaxID=1392245 RepID=A0A6A6AKY3_9PLEO|nr:RdRP-domain-containing protein [Dothidotthia symphoricarpi CBS 119687]KAF2132226.1 RdRP-domain-containing protein [Dothidotthia symphoricarpi CBS 119687]
MESALIKSAFLDSTPTYGHSPSKPTAPHFTPTPRSGQHPQSTLTLKSDGKHWARLQEYKVKVLGIRKSYWTNDVYDAMSQYGTVVRIEIQTGGRDNNAWVVPIPEKILPPKVQIGKDSARIDDSRSSSVPPTVVSPVNPAKVYYEFNILFANSIEFGTRTADMTMVSMHTVDAPGKVQVMLSLKRKEVDIQFPLNINNQSSNGKPRKFRFRLPISLLSHIYKVQSKGTDLTTLIIPFDSPPQFFMQRNEGESTGSNTSQNSFSETERSWNDWNTWHRETDIIDVDTRKQLEGKPLMSHKDKAIIDIGRWTSYRISFDTRRLTGPQFEEFSAALADHGVAIEDLEEYTVKDKSIPPLRNLLQEEISGTHPHFEPSNTGSAFDLFNHQIHLNFPVRYQLEACLSNGYLKEHSITNEFLETLASMDPGRAVHILEKVVDKQDTYYNSMDIFKIRNKGSLEKKVPNYCVLQRSALITPTMVHVASPIMETSNRIIRKYAADADRFIRIKFSDEKTEGGLRNMPGDRAESTFDRVRQAMKYGVVIAGRYYEFLAFGNSQFREHGAYFYAPTSSKSADDIRLSLGRFDHIKTVAKFGARLGQCFSTTRAMRVSVKIQKIPDVERNGYVFTDGVGKISLFLAQMAAQELGLANAFDDPPSLYQFRLGGCKGVLALDPKTTGSEVHIRPSQQKFEAEYTGLEIIRSSALATPFFNRQIIIVLSNLGVPDNIFVKKQQDMVNDYELAMTDEETAIEKLRKHIDMNQSTLIMASMVLDGFMASQEPFMMSLLRLWRAYTIKNLKEKARIAVDDGAFVLGCVDETATLQGHMNAQSKLATRDQKLKTLPEIFLQISDTDKKGQYKIIQGVCILARNPSLHPGDLRVVRAVDVPALHHLKNVVVFPQTGDRDLANMCSGGDLDGDDYMVLWDSTLIPEHINLPPMDFTPDKPLETNKPITAADISEFFVLYMKNDSLGQIAHAHLAQADWKTDGVMDDTCLELAQLHSQAVDYPKSGIPAMMNRDLKPPKWPHFMEKKYLAENKIYQSKKILGQLYDQVQLVDFKPQADNGFDKRILEAFKLEDTMLLEAAEVKTAYDEALRRLMAKHSIHTEFEAWSVFVLSHNHESRDYKFAEEFGRTVGVLKAQFRETCRAAAGITGVADQTKLGPFVAAMYQVTAKEVEAALQETKDPGKMPLISFPWLFASELGKIATRTSVPVQVLEPVIHQKLPRRQKNDSHTEEGVTRYGELLSLDFGSVQSESKLSANQSSAQQPSAEQLQGLEMEIDTKSKKPSALDMLNRLG